MFYSNSKKEVSSMAKKCNPSPKVSKAGKTLSTSKSAGRKASAGKTLANHKSRKH